MKVSRLPAALAYKLIRRGCSPADLATLAMLWPRGGHVPQQTKAGRVVILSAIFASSRLVSWLVCPTSKLKHRGSDGSASSGKNSGNSTLSLALFAAPCSHARVKPGPSQTNCQVSDSGCVVTVRDTGVASLAVPEHGSERQTAAAGLSKVASPSHSLGS